MKKLFFIYAVYIFIFISGSAYGLGEDTITLGGSSSWRMAESRTGVTEVSSIRPYPVLVLSSAGSSAINASSGYLAATGVWGNFTPLSAGTGSSLDMYVSFDERETGFFRDSTGNYRVSASSAIDAVDRRYARAGTGAALFDGNSPLTVEPQNGNSLFTGGKRIRDFTIEFWLYPLNMENGEQILSWSAVKLLNGNYAVQRIICDVSRNRLNWSFVNFFTSTDGASHIDIEFAGNVPVVPKTWSHHLVRFDAATGMVEYLVDGISEAIVYATSTGHENPYSFIGRSAVTDRDVYTPVIGSNGAFLLGERFMGLMDEFKIHNVCAGRSSVQKYPPEGGKVQTAAIDLGSNNSGIVRIDVSGGRTGIRGNSINNEFRENGRFRFSDDAQMHFFIRASENPYLLNNSPWISFTPGENISFIQGRYVQIAVDFYPSADGETSPYLSELRVVYLPGEPPMPPRNVTAAAVDGGVLLRWRHSPDINTAGYLIYYSSVRGELFGEEALLGASPIDAGYRNHLFIDGLKNGTLYYFRIAAYDYISGTSQQAAFNYNAGEFSAEVTARPLAGLSLSEISQGPEALTGF